MPAPIQPRGGVVPGTPSSTAAAAVDLSQVAPGSAAFQQLSPAQQQAVRDARAFTQAHFAGLAPPPRILVATSPGNGGQPVTVIVPPGAKPPLEVHTHYHGDRSRALSTNPAAEALAKTIAAGGSTVYVLPEAKSTTGRTDWTNVSSLAQTTSDALAQAGLGDPEISRRSASVHSAGGRALVQALKAGEQLSLDQLVIQDALFEGETGPGAATALKQLLPGASAGVADIVIVPSVGNRNMPDRDQPTKNRTAVLEETLRRAGRPVQVLPSASTHDAAATVLRPSGPVRVTAAVDTFGG